MVFGVDNRERININNYDKYSTFVQIIATFPDGMSFQGSGAMIGSNDVLTAAHVIYSKENGGYVTEVEVVPSKFGDYEPFGKILADNIYASLGWVNYEDIVYDYGVISLSTPIGFQTGWLDISYQPSLQNLINSNTLLLSYGYAGDKENGEWMYKTQGIPDDIYNSSVLLFEDDMDLYFGQSGSAVINPISKEIIGLVSAEFSNPNYNGILALNFYSYNTILNYASYNNSNLEKSIYNYTSKEKITALYIAFFDRAPDEEGLNYWENKVNTLQDGADISQEISTLFSKHEVFTTLYEDLNNQDFIENIYLNILGTNGDEEGVDFWTNMLDTKSRAEVVNNFVTASLNASLESEDFATLSYEDYLYAKQRQDKLINKIEVSIAFVDILSENTNIKSYDYLSDQTYQASKNILKYISQDYDTVTSTIDYLYMLENTINPIEQINEDYKQGFLL